MCRFNEKREEKKESRERKRRRNAGNCSHHIEITLPWKEWIYWYVFPWKIHRTINKILPIQSSRFQQKMSTRRHYPIRRWNLFLLKRKDEHSIEKINFHISVRKTLKNERSRDWIAVNLLEWRAEKNVLNNDRHDSRLSFCSMRNLSRIECVQTWYKTKHKEKIHLRYFIWLLISSSSW